MSLWRLEWLRLLRTKRLIGIFAAYLFCGLTGPLLTKYQEQILKQLGGGMKIEFPPVTVAALVDAYVKNAAQIAVLLKAPNTTGMLAGTLYGALYYVFVIAVVAWAAAVTRGGIGAVALTLGTLIGLPVLGLLKWLAPWMPSYLVSSMTALSEGARPVSEFLRAAAVTAVATWLMLWLAIRRTARRAV